MHANVPPCRWQPSKMPPPPRRTLPPPPPPRRTLPPLQAVTTRAPSRRLSWRIWFFPFFSLLFLQPTRSLSHSHSLALSRSLAKHASKQAEMQLTTSTNHLRRRTHACHMRMQLTTSTNHFFVETKDNECYALIVATFAAFAHIRPHLTTGNTLTTHTHPHPPTHTHKHTACTHSFPHRSPKLLKDKRIV